MKKSFYLIASVFFTASAFSQTLQDAIKLTTNEQYEKADASFKTLLTATPNNGELLFYYGENFFKHDVMDQANATYQKGADLNATNPLPYVGLGKVQWYQNKFNDAKANFYKATTLAAGKNATVLLKIAEVYINAETKDFVEAGKLLDQAQKLEPKNPEVLLLKGDAVLEQSNDGSKAIAFYEEAAKLDPKSVTATLRIGKLWNRAKNYTSALDYYKKAKSIDSSFAPAYREMAEIYGRAGQYGNAVANYKRYLELNNDCGARAFYAGFLLEAKHYSESIEAAKEALKCDPNNVYLYRYIAYDCYEMVPADYTNGLENSNLFFEKAKPDTKIIVKDYEYHAKLLAKNGKDSLAIIDFKKALELQPDKVELYGDMAAAYLKMKKYQDALSHYQKKIAATTKPSINDYLGLARTYYQMKEFEKADSATSEMIKIQPETIYGYLWKAKTRMQLDPNGETGAAKQACEDFISKIKPEEADKNKSDWVNACNYLAAYYAKQKDCANVKLYMQKVLERDPENAQAKKVIAGLKC